MAAGTPSIRGLQEIARGPVENHRGQRAGHEGAGVDADTVFPHIRPRGDRVAMDDDVVMARPGIEEFAADPNQVALILVGQGDPRPDPGMNERVVALDMGEQQPVEKILVVGREVAGDLSPTLVMQLFRVDDGTTLWRGEFEVGPDLDRSALLLRVALDVTDVLDLPR